MGQKACLKKPCSASDARSETTASSCLDDAPESDADLGILLCTPACALRFYSLNTPQPPHRTGATASSTMSSQSGITFQDGSSPEISCQITNGNNKPCRQLFCDVQNDVAANEAIFFFHPPCIQRFIVFIEGVKCKQLIGNKHQSTVQTQLGKCPQKEDGQHQWEYPDRRRRASLFALLSSSYLLIPVLLPY